MTGEVGLEAAAYTVLEVRGNGTNLCECSYFTNSLCPSTPTFSSLSPHLVVSTGMYVFVPLLVTLKDIY